MMKNHKNLSRCIVLVGFILSHPSVYSQVDLNKINNDDRSKLSELFDSRKSRNSYAGMSIYVTGEINDPRIFKAPHGNEDSTTLGEIIKLTGGQTEHADKIRIYIYRDGNKFLINRSIGNMNKILLDGGDLVFFPPKVFAGR